MESTTPQKSVANTSFKTQATTPNTTVRTPILSRLYSSELFYRNMWFPQTTSPQTQQPRPHRPRPHKTRKAHPGKALRHGDPQSSHETIRSRTTSWRFQAREEKAGRRHDEAAHGRERDRGGEVHRAGACEGGDGGGDGPSVFGDEEHRGFRDVGGFE